MATPKDNEEGFKLSQQAKEDLLKIGLIGFGAWWLHRKITRAVFGDPGATTKVDYDYNKTQERCIVINSTTGETYCEPDAWHPYELANRLHSEMSGIARPEYGETGRSIAWEDVTKLGRDRARWLHNYWLENVDGEDTVYRWIKGEIVLRWSEEHDQREAAKDVLRGWGIGF